ncbi:SRPBCC family protein [Bacillus salacetis]|uniref:SRPBCC family protein n=1 Tax=Bacillus salacetis TaxID=2315464 RepID=UPI001F0C419E|nr:SRPBCC family protein [Bacillus salacetis]
MPVIHHQQFIKAPINLCFDLARSIDVHTQTTSKTKEKAVGGVTEGLLEEGDIVTWEAVHLGIKQRLTAKVTSMEKPTEFVDIMVKGAFHSFEHTHQFIEKAVFAYIVAFGKIPGAGFFPCIQRFYSQKRTSSSFLSCSPGFLRRLTGYYLKFILNSNKVYEKSH